MSQNLVTFKGNQEGIYIYIKEGSFQIIKEQLEHKLKKAGTFFSGAKVINIKGKELSSEEAEELEGIIKNKYGLFIDGVKEEENTESIENIDLVNDTFFDGIHEGQTKFISATIRSGQSIEYEGNELPEKEGILATRQLLERAFESLA